MMVCMTYNNHSQHYNTIDRYYRSIGQHNDSRMNIALIMTAVKYGAIVANHCEVTALHKASTGKLNGARLKDSLTGKEWDIQAKVRLYSSCVFTGGRISGLHLQGNYQCYRTILRHPLSSGQPNPPTYRPTFLRNSHNFAQLLFATHNGSP
jgi:hypothetical protein